MLPIHTKIPVSISVIIISSGISGKRGNFARFTHSFEKIFRGISFHLTKFSRKRCENVLGKVAGKSIRKLMNFRNANHSTEKSEISDKWYL